MKFDTSIFKSYDVRGIYPDTINEEIAEKIGTAFAAHFKMKTVAVGMDGRISSPVLAESLSLGIRKTGADVINLGLTSSDMTYFASGHYEDVDGAIMITASHNPKQYNGFKFCLKGAIAVSGDDLAEVKEMITKNISPESEKIGTEMTRDIYRDYGVRLLEIADLKEKWDLKIVIDAGNGVAGEMIKQCFSFPPPEIIPLYFEVDGSFPNHPANPIEETNLTDLKLKVIKEKADFGIAFDGDGDRAFFIDENGKTISSTIITALLSEYFLKKNKKSSIIHSLLCGNIVKETIEKNHGNAIESRVGHSHIKKLMREKDAVFGGEHSGHYYFKELSYADSGLMASVLVAKTVNESEKTLSEILEKYEKYSTAEEKNFTVKNGKSIIEIIKNKYKSGKQSELDGLSVKYPTWHFNVRMSGTEPLMRLNLEADTKELMDQKIDEISEIITQS